MIHGSLDGTVSSSATQRMLANAFSRNTEHLQRQFSKIALAPQIQHAQSLEKIFYDTASAQMQRIQDQLRIPYLPMTDVFRDQVEASLSPITAMFQAQLARATYPITQDAAQTLQRAMSNNLTGLARLAEQAAEMSAAEDTALPNGLTAPSVALALIVVLGLSTAELD